MMTHEARHHQKNSCGAHSSGRVGGLLLMICKSSHDQNEDAAVPSALNTQPMPLLCRDSKKPSRLLTISKNSGAKRAATVEKTPTFSFSPFERRYADKRLYNNPYTPTALKLKMSESI